VRLEAFKELEEFIRTGAFRVASDQDDAPEALRLRESNAALQQSLLEAQGTEVINVDTGAVTIGTSRRGRGAKEAAAPGRGCRDAAGDGD